MLQDKVRQKKNTDKVRKLIHKTFKTLKIVFEALEVLKTMIQLFH